MGSKFVVGGMDETVARFVLARNPMMSLDDTPYTAIGQMNAQGEIIGGCVFTNYTKIDIHGNLAGDGNWLSKRFLGECFRYIFQHLGCRRATGIVAASNFRAQKFDEGLGFVYEGTLRQYLPNGEDAHIYGMLREECRWLNVGVAKNGSTRHAAASVSRCKPAPGIRRGPSIARLANAPDRPAAGSGAAAEQSPAPNGQQSPDARTDHAAHGR